MIFIGVFEATITSPTNAEDRATRDIYARAYLKALQDRINNREGQHSIEFRLISTQSGCIVCKVAAFLAPTAVASLLMLGHVDVARYTSYVRGTLNKWTECKVEQEKWACRLLDLDINFGTRFYKTVEGDTLDSVLRVMFNVNRNDVEAVAKLTEAWYPHVLEDPVTKRLKPGYFIARLKPGMPMPSKALQSSLRSPLLN
jgi:hypothetical protein